MCGQIVQESEQFFSVANSFPPLTNEICKRPVDIDSLKWGQKTDYEYNYLWGLLPRARVIST